jgi:hypothetical protein
VIVRPEGFHVTSASLEEVRHAHHSAIGIDPHVGAAGIGIRDVLKAIPSIDGSSVCDEIRESGTAEQEKAEARTLLFDAEIGPSRCSRQLHIRHEAPKGREVISSHGSQTSVESINRAYVTLIDGLEPHLEGSLKDTWARGTEWEYPDPHARVREFQASERILYLKLGSVAALARNHDGASPVNLRRVECPSVLTDREDATKDEYGYYTDTCRQITTGHECSSCTVAV